MVVLLYSVSVLLVAAGLSAALWGADTIRSESGAAWLQAGAIWAASGFILLALTAALRELRRIRQGLADMALEVEEVPAPGAPASLPPAATGDRAAAAIAGAGLGAAAAGLATAFATRGDAPAPEGDEAAASAAGIAVPGHAPEGDAREQTPASSPDQVEHERAGHEEPPAPAGPRTVVGTYASGGTTYLMYSDGTIEADMPDGRYRFNSMMELRHFVETGEGGVRIPDPEPLEPAPSGVGAA